MNLISMEDISKTLNDTPLFSRVTTGIDSGEKIGLIGANGSGKSTFLKILTGKLEPDSGKIYRNNRLTMSMLAQNTEIPEGATVRDFLRYSDSPEVALINDYHRCLEEVGRSGGSGSLLEELTERMEAENGWNIENSYISFLSELGINEPDRPLSELSGGMLKKSALARTLAPSSELLVLDEPTNHLDTDTIEWLEKYLKERDRGFIMVTHDRYFLDSVCSIIMELDRETVYKYQGNYSVFLEKREERLNTELNEQQRIQSILRTELEWLKRGPRARTGKDKKRKMKINDLMDRRSAEEHESEEFSSSHRRLGKKVLELHNISKNFSSLRVLETFTYSFKKGERIGILGENGSGKTTFLEILTGRLAADTGSVDTGINTVFGYYDQFSAGLEDAAGNDLTVLEYIRKTAENITMSDGRAVSAAKFLEMFNFPAGMHRIELGRLSGGEKRRLYLISILIRNPNFLVLDEPTNDLDIETLRKLEEYLLSFQGTLLAVSHDRAFLDRITDYMFVFDGTGRINGFSGNYSDYREYLRSEKQAPPATAGKEQKPVVKKEKEVKIRLTFREKQEFSKLEAEIEALENEKQDLETLFSSGDIEPDKIGDLNKKYKNISELIDRKLGRWEELASVLEQEK